MRLSHIGLTKPFLPTRTLRQIRFISTAHNLLQKEASKSKDAPKNFNPRHLGVASEIYVPASYKNLPNAFSHPITFFNALIRRIYIFGLNTVQVGLFRYQSGLKPKFLLWKNKAIESYVNINTAFSQRKLDDVKPLVSLWVEEALEARSRQLPRYIQLDWQLVKFNEVPKLVSVQAMMIPGRPLENIQLVYKFNTTQRLIKLNKKTNQADKLDRNVVDYVVFLCDATTNDLILLGSVFESKPDMKLPKNYEDNTQLAIERMKRSGDLFRLPPP